MSFGRRVKEARKRAKLSQEGLARRAGMSMPGVAKIEQGGATDPHFSTLQKLAEALAVDPLWLVAGEEVEEPVLSAPKVKAPEPGPLLDMALAAARRDEEKLWQAVNRADASEGLSAVTEYEEDKFRAQVRALGFPDEYFEGFIWPLVQEAVRAGHLEQENARLKEELDRAHVDD